MWAPNGDHLAMRIPVQIHHVSVHRKIRFLAVLI
ncbi:unnamed protein product [Gongylonema pulchrum]|uniref:Uncharacterized protein n=1 Tax=Gongylonema pulchrum TaxID=637853 RepID=A0A183F110_9BILA|nr:unnamed protein product [Gongylonema pulchrum]